MAFFSGLEDAFEKSTTTLVLVGNIKKDKTGKKIGPEDLDEEARYDIRVDLSRDVRAFYRNKSGVEVMNVSETVHKGKRVYVQVVGGQR